MKKHIFKYLYMIMMIILLLFFHSVSFAVQVTEETGGGGTSSDSTLTNESNTKYEEKLDKITSDVRKIAIAFIVLAGVATGIIYMTASMNPENKSWAKTALMGLIIGTFILALSGDIGKLVMGALNAKQSDLKVSNAKRELSVKAKAESFAYEQSFGSEIISEIGKGVQTLREKLLAVRNEVVRRQSESYARSTCTTIQIPVWTIQNGKKVSSKKSLEVSKDLVPQVTAIFNDIYNDPERFPVKLVGAWNWRDGNLRLPNHPSGMAIDINWEENYFIQNGKVQAGRLWEPGKNEFSIPPNGSVVKAFKKYGWDWGGDWNSSKDYMHFSALGG